MPTRASEAILVHVLDAGFPARRGRSAASAGLGRGDRTAQVVERRKQLAGELRQAAPLRSSLILRRALAEVLEVGLGALGQRQVLVALGCLGHELVEVVLDRGRGLWPGRVLGRAGRPPPRRLQEADARRPALPERLGAAWGPSGAPGWVGGIASLALVDDLRVDDVLLSGAVGVSRAVGARTVAGRPSLLLGCAVHRLGHGVEGRVQGLGLGLDLLRVLGLERLADLLDGRLDLVLGGRVNRLAQLGELTLSLVGGVLAVVAGLGQLALPGGPPRRGSRRR